MKGVNSKDLTLDTLIVPFINRNISTYPTEVGSAFFAPVPIKEQKDVMLNIARANAEQEYQRIISLVAVLQQQAEELQNRLKITELVHQAKYNYKPVVGNVYWLVETNKETILSHLGPDDWSTGSPKDYKYISKLKFLGDFTWIEIKE